MPIIDVYYNKRIIEDEKYFKSSIDDLKSNFSYDFIFHETDKIDFKIKFNNKTVYSLEDNFDTVKSIDKNVLLKSKKMLQSAVISIKSKVYPSSDDMSIDDY
jgi:hypothetical protein